jgi:exonuclease SbcC
VVKQVRREQRELSKALDERSGRREVVRKEGKRLREEAERLKRTGAELQQAQTDAAALRAHLEALPKLREEARTLLERAAADDALLTAAGADTEELAAVTEQLARIVYDSEEHARLRARLEELSLYAEVKGRLEEASGRRSRLTEDIATLTDRLEAEDRQASERRDALAALATQLEALPGLREDVANSRRVLDESRATAQEAGRERVRLTEEAARLERTAADLAAATGAEREAAARHRVHTRLAQAFGRGGIPDRIIENALPELTHEANEFLGRLSDYEMSVQFILDKPTKSGSVRETFDVLVNHDGGVRDFQMFSGGEAFRIAFAIRLGLSKLLVRRAGARLETLVIDEGFGTQDPEGRERLVEAINLARREFAKVLVITHLDELKDVFGTQLRVTKDTPQGSRVEFVGA